MLGHDHCDTGALASEIGSGTGLSPVCHAAAGSETLRYTAGTAEARLAVASARDHIGYTALAGLGSGAGVVKTCCSMTKVLTPAAVKDRRCYIPPRMHEIAGEAIEGGAEEWKSVNETLGHIRHKEKKRKKEETKPVVILLVSGAPFCFRAGFHGDTFPP